MQKPMDAAIECFRAFIAAEHAARVAFHLEPSLAALREKLTAVWARMDITPKNVMSIQPSGRLKDLTPDEVAAAEQTIANLRYVPRALFMVERYAHKDHGEVFVAYVSDNQEHVQGAPSQFAARLIAKDIDGTVKIVGMQSRDPFAKDASKKLVWAHHQGTRITGLTTPVATERFEAPGEQLSRAHWDR